MKTMQKFIYLLLLLIYLSTVSYSNANESSEIFLRIGHSSGVSSICYSHDGKYIVSGGDKTIKIWNIEDGKPIRTYKGHTSFVRSVCISSDNRYIASGSCYGIKLWNVKTGKIIRTFRTQSEHLSFRSRPVCFSPDGSRIASAKGLDKAIRLWDIENGNLIMTLKDNYAVDTLCFSPDGSYIASGRNKTIKLWNVNDGTLIKSFIDNAQTGAFRFSPDGNFIASEGDDKTIKLWNINNGKIVRTFNGHPSYNEFAGFTPDGSLDFSPDSSYIACGSYGGTITLWNTNDDRPVWSIKGHSKRITSLCFSPNGFCIATGSEDNTIKIWKSNNGSLFKVFKGNSSQGIKSIIFSPNDVRVGSGGYDEGKKVWQVWLVNNGERIRSFKDYHYSSPVFLADDDIVIMKNLTYCTSNFFLSLRSINANRCFGTSYKGFEIQLMDIKTKKDVCSFKAHDGEINSVNFSPDARYLASGSQDGTIKLWNVENCTYVRTLMKKELVQTVTFSPDGKCIATEINNTIYFWDVNNGRLIRSFNGHHSDMVHSMSFSPDGKYVASGSSDNTINLFNVEDGTLIRTFKGHTGDVNSVCFSSNSKLIASGSRDNTIRIWNVNNENDSYIFQALPDDEWISYKSGSTLYNSSPNGHKYAAIRYNNDTFNYQSLLKDKGKYKRVIVKGTFQYKTPIHFTENQLDVKSLTVELKSKHEGKIKNAIDLDEDIKVYAKCSDKTILLTYNEDFNLFAVQPQCSNGTINIVSYKYEQYSLLNFSQPNQQFVIDMAFKKPVLYVLINPNKHLNKPPLTISSEFSNKLKDQQRILSHKLDGNQRYWQNRWQRAYFFTQHAGKEPKWLCNQGNIATKWNDPDFITQYNEKIQFQNQSIPYNQLIDDACTFIKGFSISEKLNLKGASIIVIGTPDSQITNSTLNLLEQKLKENKVCAMIAQFGAKEHDYTNNTFKYLKLIEFDMKKEFLNNFFQQAFERIMKEFTELYDRHQAN